MSNLVLLSGERAKREQADQMKLIMGLQELLAMAESGEIKAVCFASIDRANENVTLGILRGEDTALHEMIGIAHILSDANRPPCSLQRLLKVLLRWARKASGSITLRRSRSGTGGSNAIATGRNHFTTSASAACGSSISRSARSRSGV